MKKYNVLCTCSVHNQIIIIANSVSFEEAEKEKEVLAKSGGASFLPLYIHPVDIWIEEA